MLPSQPELDQFAQFIANALSRCGAVTWLGEAMAAGQDREWKSSEELFHVALREGLLNMNGNEEAPQHIFDEVEYAVCDKRPPRASDAQVHTAWRASLGPAQSAQAANVRKAFNAGSADMLLAWKGRPVWTELKRENSKTALGGTKPGALIDLEKLLMTHGDATRTLYTLTGTTPNPKINDIRNKWSHLFSKQAGPMLGAAIAICNTDQAKNIGEKLKEAASTSPAPWRLSRCLPVSGGRFSLLVGMVELPSRPSGTTKSD